MNIMRFVPAVLITVCTTGCASFCVHGVITQDAQANHEFTEAYREDQQADTIRGIYAGDIEDRAQVYSCYQFTNALSGAKNRVLEVLVPTEKGNRAIIRETSNIRLALDQADLLTWRGERLVIVGFALDTHPGINYRHSLPRTISVCTSVNPPVHPAVDALAVRGSRNEWTRYDADLDVDWRVRSRTRWALWHMAYLVTIPLDTVTFPIQYVWCAVFPPG